MTFIAGTVRNIVIGAALLVAVAPAAWAQHHRHGHGPRVSFGISFGAPLWPAWYGPRFAYFPPPVYVPPRVVYVSPPEPVVYVEREVVQVPAAPAAPPAPPVASTPQSWWYYCSGSQGYYPYVRDCPGGWQRVAPQPSN